jgi:hypothetical protein
MCFIFSTQIQPYTLTQLALSVADDLVLIASPVPYQKNDVFVRNSDTVPHASTPSLLFADGTCQVLDLLFVDDEDDVHCSSSLSCSWLTWQLQHELSLFFDDFFQLRLLLVVFLDAGRRPEMKAYHLVVLVRKANDPLRENQAYRCERDIQVDLHERDTQVDLHELESQVDLHELESQGRALLGLKVVQ